MQSPMTLLLASRKNSTFFFQVSFPSLSPKMSFFALSSCV